MFQLYKLGWHSFQQLCITILREVLGQTVESFLDSNDAGRDGAFSGTWSPTDKENLSGKFVFQCKFTEKQGYNLTISDINGELDKIKRLVDKGLCDCYVLITNAGLSARRQEQIEKIILSTGVKQFIALGETWITEQIKKNAKLRMLVPRIYGLGDLSQILDDRALEQAKAMLESLKDDIAKVVKTKSYQKAAEALDTHGFVLLVGAPAVGKTTIASLLAMASLDIYEAFTLKVKDATHIKNHWNPNESSRFFWVDDAFGVTQYESHLAKDWNHYFPDLKTMIDRGNKIVLTSRDYIYKRARKDLKESAFPLLHESQVVIDVKDLSKEERKQILYNHLKLGKQPNGFLKKIKPFLEEISEMEAFVPETARRLSDPAFTKHLLLTNHYIRGSLKSKRSF